MYSEKSKLHERQRQFRAGNLRTIALDVTPRCNMHCPHCYADTFRTVEPIEIEILRNALEEAFQLGVFHYVMQGGEAIMDAERLQAIVEIVHPDETYINLVSNGWAMTREKIEWLKSIKVDKITLSLDSGIAEEHDVRRMPESFERVITAIDNVREAGLLCSISTVVTHSSLYSKGFNKAYQLALDKGIRMDVQIAMPVGKWDGRKEELITAEDSRYIKQLQLNGPILSNGQRLIGRDIYTGDQDHCPAGTEFMGISCDGHVLPCNFLQFSLGNIRDRSLKEMREELLANKWFDGKHPNCIAGEDDDFIDTFIMPYIGHAKPLDAYEVYQLQRRNQ
jgi:MoaA/NifB/PqqE/SkfB family radical SAM enzyme